MVGFIFIHYIFKTLLDQMNIRAIQTEVPEEFKETYELEKYKKSQLYLKDGERFFWIKRTFFLGVTFAVLYSDSLDLLDGFVRGFELSSTLTGLFYLSLLLLAKMILDVPFSLYHTFVIEQKFGFNKMSLKTFILDFFKGIILTAFLGLPLLTLTLWLLGKYPSNAWVYVWAIVSIYQTFLMFVAPAVIMPLFNKFTPLKEGPLKTAIDAYAKEHGFALKGVFTMDGSKRSSKSNAFFTGIGKYRRIVLFDTLIEQLTTEELMAVLAHEMGHFKKGHILKGMGISLLTMGLYLWGLSLCVQYKPFFDALGLSEVSVYLGLVVFSFVISPFQFFMSIFSSIFSRKNEYEADRYSIETYKNPESMISALKKLTVNNLSNLTPHPWKVFFEYSHPPVKDRIEEIRRLS